MSQDRFGLGYRWFMVGALCLALVGWQLGAFPTQPDTANQPTFVEGTRYVFVWDCLPTWAPIVVQG